MRSVYELVLAVIAVAGFAVLSTGFAGAEILDGKIYPNVTIAGYPVGGQTPAAARIGLVTAATDFVAQPFTVTLGSRQWTMTGAELGLQLDVDGAVSLAMTAGRTSSSPLNFFDQIDIAIPVTFGEQFSASLQTITAVTDQPAVEPTLTVVPDQVTIETGSTGRVLDQVALKQALIDQAAHLQNQPIPLSVVTDVPARDVADLAGPKILVETILSRPVVVQFEKRTWEIAPATLASWIQINDTRVNTGRQVETIAEVGWDDQAMEAFIKEIAADITIEPQSTVKLAARETAKPIVEGHDGRVVDVTTAIAYMKEAALDRNEKSLVLPVVTVPTPEEIESVPAPKPTGRVLSVDVAKQIAFAHEDGQLVYYAKASTGRRGYDTPTGEFKVYAKIAKQKMSGPGYYLPNVPWILFYDRGYSFHGTYWHNNFGTPMSHGCSNLSIEDAKWFYDFAEVGTPVVVYSSATS